MKYANLAGAGDRSNEPSGRKEFHICLGEEPDPSPRNSMGFPGDGEGMFDGRTLKRVQLSCLCPGSTSHCKETAKHSYVV